MGCANYISNLYGVHQLLADIDRGRQFWDEGRGGVVSTILSWASGEGFPGFMRQMDMEYHSTHEFRNRYLLQVLATRMG